eukprot:855629-Amphidinium_carterae.1
MNHVKCLKVSDKPRTKRRPGIQEDAVDSLCVCSRPSTNGTLVYKTEELSGNISEWADAGRAPPQEGK